MVLQTGSRASLIEGETHNAFAFACASDGKFFICSHISRSLRFNEIIHKVMSIEQRFDIPLIAALALKEKQIQQNYRPIIAVHKWFARRPGTLFRGLLLSEFVDQRLDETYFAGHDFAGKLVADPFMGGGSPLIEANRIGCDVLGLDINPMAAWIVREEIEHLDHAAYRKAASRLVTALAREVGELYRTDCPAFGEKGVPVKYFLWVKTIPCEACGCDVDLFPGYLLADDTRHPRNVLVCATCGELNEVEDIKRPGRCTHWTGQTEPLRLPRLRRRDEISAQANGAARTPALRDRIH